MSKVYQHIFELNAPIKIPSVNSMYKPKSSFGKSFAWLYKDSKVQLYQDQIIKQALDSDLKALSLVTDEIDYIDLRFIFLLDKNFFKRDVSNMIKMTEDALMEITKCDDSKHRRVSAVKALSLFPKREFVICEYEVHFNENK